MKAVPYILGISQGVVKEMAGSSHTPASCLSKPRSSQEAAKKQIRVWLQYFCSGAKVLLLYSSFSVPLVILWSPYGDLEMARNGFEDSSKWCATGNTCSGVNEAGFVASRTLVHGPTNTC